MSEFGEDPINEAIYSKRGIMGAIEALFGNGSVIPGVMMIMCGIDILSNVVREEEESKPKDFTEWVRRYLHIPGDDVLTPDDIWAARCALVHTYGLESRKVRSGDARRIIWLQNPLTAVGYAPSVDAGSVRVDPFAFRDAFTRAVAEFLVAVSKDKGDNQLIEGRLKELTTYSRFIDERLRYRGE